MLCSKDLDPVCIEASSADYNSDLGEARTSLSLIYFTRTSAHRSNHLLMIDNLESFRGFQGYPVEGLNLSILPLPLVS